MNTTRLLIAALVTTAVLVTPSTVKADGTTEQKQECSTTVGAYGQTSKVCKTNVAQKYKAGLGDLNFWTIALILSAGAAIFYGASKVTDRIYWFD